MRSNAKQIALGGMLAAVAAVIMCMGSLIPVNTYVCPILCILITRPVLQQCGRTIGWCYYMAVGLLSLIMAPDKEAALIYVFLGYYPMVRPWLERLPGNWLRMVAKITLFSLSGVAVYWLLLAVLGLESLRAEFDGVGLAGLMILLVVWNVLFLMTDRLLGMKFRKRM